MNDIVVVFYFYSRRNKSKGHASCLFMNIIVDSVPWQRSYWEILRESHLLLYHRLLAISRVAEQQKTCLCCCIRPLVTPRRSYAIGVVCLSVSSTASRITHERVYGCGPNIVVVDGQAVTGDPL